MANEEEQLKFLFELAKHQGAVVNPTTDGGHLIVCQRSFLQEILNKKPDQEFFVILIKGSKNNDRKGD